MGVNYYWESTQPPKPPPCPTCGHDPHAGEGPLQHHIGKSSYGWTFSFATCPALGVRSYREWLAVFAADPTGRIINEVGEVRTVEAFKELVERKRNEPRMAAVGSGASPRSFVDDEGHSFNDGGFS